MEVTSNDPNVKLLTLDPGLRHTGWAVFGVQAKTLIKSGVSLRAPAEPQLKAAAEQAIQLEYMLSCDPTIGMIACEFPAMWGSHKSFASAVRGDLLILTYLVGSLGFAVYRQRGHGHFHAIPVQAWKGQLTKEAVIIRIKKVIGPRKIRNHEADAIGLGLIMLGRF